MEQEYAIEVQDVYKSFKVYYDKSNQLREKVLFHNRNRFEIREILKGISFQVQKGEAIALIGKNGCGKSTTLKMLTRILKPNAGTIKMNGRVSSLIELGAGFHPDMTGRENIYINASIFGIKKKEVDERLERIIRFSELEDFIDNPVRTYSSGMYMRLAFSVAINVDADILLIDEILAVGDQAFQEKCFQKLKEIKEAGTTIVIVSHSLGQIEKICDRVVWIEDGKIKEIGATRKVCKAYTAAMQEKRLNRAKKEIKEIVGELESKKALVKDSEEYRQMKMKESCYEICSQCGPDARREGNGKVEFTNIEILGENKEKTLCFHTGEKFILKIDYETDAEIKNADFNFSITREDWTYCYGTSIRRKQKHLMQVSGNGTLELIIEKLNLLPGRYFIDVGVCNEEGERYDHIFNIVELVVELVDIQDVGIAAMDAYWKGRNLE